MSALWVSLAAVLCNSSDTGLTPVSRQDVHAPYDAAVKHRLDGRFEDAIAELSHILSQSPENLDARLQLGLALLGVGRLDEAEIAFTQVLVQAPDYADARLGLVRVARAKGNLVAARAMLDQAEASGTTPASDVADLRHTLADPPPPWRATVSSSSSRLSDDLPDWRSASVVVSRRIGVAHTATGAIEVTERFGQDAVYLEGRIDQRLGNGSAYLSVGGARNTAYRAETAVWTGFSTSATKALSAGLDAGWARYRAGTVTSLRPSIVYTVGPAAVTAQAIAVRDETGDWRGGYSLHGSLTTMAGLRVHAARGEAPETSDGMTVDVAFTAVGLAIAMTPAVTLHLDGVHEDRSAYDRDEVSLALGWRF